MALSGSVETNHFSDSSVNETYMQFNWSATQSISGNYSTVTWEIVAHRVNTSNYVYFHNFTRNVNGSSGSKGSINYKNDEVIDSGSFTVYHNDNGTGSFSLSMSANIYYSSGGAISVSKTFILDTIPRYTTLSTQEGNKGVDYFYINWSTTDVIDALQYSLNGGSWINVSMNGTQGGYFYVSASPNTTYSVKCRARRKDSQLWTTKGPISITTYDIARLTSYPNFNLGDSVTIKYTNPSGADIEVGLYDVYGGDLALYRKATGNSYTFNFTDEELDKIYKVMEKNNSLNVCFYINTNQNKYRDYKTVVVTLTGNQKTCHTNVDGAWKRTKRWTNVDGAWKRCVRWVNVNGTWKRCI